MSRKSLTPIELPADPVNPLEAATKQYADTKAAGVHYHSTVSAYQVTDWNNLIGPTAFGYNITSGIPNSPEAGFHVGMVSLDNSDSTSYTQTIWGALDTPSDTHTWRRHKIGAAAWGSWYRLRASQAELDARYALVNATAGGDLTGTYPNPDIGAGKVGATEIGYGAVHVDHTSATGTKSSATFLRGDNTWSAPPTGGTPALAIKDDDSLLTPGPTGLNFKGEGVTATGTTEIQIAIPGVPCGSIVMWVTATPPAGWLLCNGTAVPAGAEYDALRALLTPAPWNGLLPDFTGRIPNSPGAAPGSGTVRNLGGKHGSDELSVSAMPTHAHSGTTLNTANAGTHNHTVARRSGTGSSAGLAAGSATDDGTLLSSTAPNHAHDITGNTGTSGSGAPFLPPVLNVNFIIKF